MKIKEKHKLRQPTGLHIVGCSTTFVYEYVDQEEIDAEKRMVPCLCFYPAKGMGAGRIKGYVNESIHPGTGGIETNSYLEAPIADGKFPLLLYSHGFSLFNEANTVQCEELASQGYIVLCIGHQGGGSYELANGDIMRLDMEKMMKDFQEDAKGMELFIGYSAWLTGEGKTASFEEHRDYYARMIEGQPGFTAHSEVWMKDNLEALDRFLKEAEREGTFFDSRVDKERIGAFGMSYGGSTALSLTRVSDLVKAGANLDGFYYDPDWQKPLTKPVLMMENDEGNFLTFPFMNAEGDAYLATFNDSTHANFADYNEILAENYIAKGVIDGKEVERAMLGKIDPDEMESILNALLVDFFDKYLKDAAARIIDADHVHEEVRWARK
ncbi:hypothetical protein [Cohnella lupini]|uniref:Putative dienelactone hydrolase n=1 Tax=Cohnella lupini TaxID=1294267 RepID=A0A3D9HPC6_9BACL|nr:hypothetical protein [Cohnella lupini]RED51171.1 putative dienelactone hydrolase [Cohnella lupini]